MKYTKGQVKAIYDEMERRIYMMICADSFENEYDRKQYKNAMLQGVYSALIVTASNWPEVRSWTDEIESGMA